MDLLDENALVLELVTLGEHVEGVVDVLVDLLGVAHLLEKTAEDADPAHPEDLLGKTGVGSTATLTGTCFHFGVRSSQGKDVGMSSETSVVTVTNSTQPESVIKGSETMRGRWTTGCLAGFPHPTAYCYAEGCRNNILPPCHSSTATN